MQKLREEKNQKVYTQREKNKFKEIRKKIKLYLIGLTSELFESSDLTCISCEISIFKSSSDLNPN